MTWLYVLKDRTQVFDFFQSFDVEITNRFNVKLKILKTNNTLEYKYSHF